MATLDRKGPRRSREPFRKHLKIPLQEYIRSAIQANFPSWHPEHLRQVVQDILAMAAPDKAIPGVVDSACAYIPGAGAVQVHFPGDGAVMIDPASGCSDAMFELGRALKVVLGDKPTVGRPAGVKA